MKNVSAKITFFYIGCNLQEGIAPSGMKSWLKGIHNLLLMIDENKTSGTESWFCMTRIN